MPVIDHEKLLNFTKELLQAVGTSEPNAQIVANSLVQSNLRGHDSHGVMRAPFYIARVQEGRLKADAALEVLNETDSLLLCDGGWGFGQVLGVDLMNRLMEKASKSGVAFGSLKQAAHMGRLGEYAELAAANNMVALLFVNTHGAGQRVAPVGGVRPRLGTNPICMGFPGGEAGPFVLDFGTSATAEGKVRIKKIAGEEVPLGWVIDPDGNPTTDPNQLYGDPPGTILPMGGDQAYKGFGLSFMIEMFCSALAGAPTAHPNPPAPMGNAAFFVVIDPNQCAGQSHLIQEVTQLENYVRSVPRKEGVEEIILPGDPERKTYEDRKTNGIPMDEGNWSALTNLAKELNVIVPEL